MVYYHIQSWQRDSNGSTTGEDVLKEKEGPVIPKNSCDNYSTGLNKNDYFPTYEEARAYFDYIKSSYYKAGTRASIVLRDEVKGETHHYSG